MKIVRRDYSQGAGKAEQELGDTTLPHTGKDELSLDRLIYRNIGSLTDNKSLVTPELSDTDLNRWLLDMNSLHNKKYYDESILVTADLVALDEYLGTLGITEVYPFMQDTYSVEPWMTVDTQTEYRILTDATDNTHLVDGTDNTVLVSYT